VSSIAVPSLLVLLVVAVVVLAIVWLATGRERYRSSRGAPNPRAQPTNEVFIDPETGRRMRVWFDPATGDREYHED
jgi:hypothetical protein